MHFTNIFILFSLAVTASASPLGSRNIMLSKREGPDGQSGAQINAGTDVAFAFVYRCKTCSDISYRSRHSGPLCSYYGYRLWWAFYSMQRTARGSLFLVSSKILAPKMPDLSNAASSTQISYRIGVDGINTNRVIHTGFNAIKGCDGTVTDEASYEWYPNPAIFIPPKTS